jgi:hypothetical protein
MSQLIIKASEVVLPEGKKFGWNPILVNGQIVAFENPNFGLYEHVAIIDADSKAFLYDGIRKLDGPAQEDGHSTPGEISVVVDEREDGFYLLCIKEFRPIIYDHVNKVQGVEVLGFAGGFAGKGKKPSVTAQAELLEEAGVIMKPESIKLIGYASDNRAATETCINVYMGFYDREIEAKPGAEEIIKGKEWVRIDRFTPGRDGIINSAYAMVVAELGLVHPKKETLYSRLLAWLKEEVEI